MFKKIAGTIALLLLAVTPALWGQSLGEVTLTIDDAPGENLPIANAVLYSGVALAYDTTLQIQSGGETGNYYYPQLEKGNNHILFLLLSRNHLAQNGEGDDYEVYVDLGDTLFAPMTFDSNRQRIYLFPNGRLVSSEVFGTGVSGTMALQRDEARGLLDGDFDLSFSQDLDGSGDNHKIALAGNLSADLLKGETGSLSKVKAEGKNLRRNISLAVISALFIVLFSLR